MNENLNLSRESVFYFLVFVVDFLNFQPDLGGYGIARLIVKTILRLNQML
jgi:hypothetical protein